AHHVDMGVPWRNLPRLHDELVAAGWLTPQIEYPTYRTFWKACSAGERLDHVAGAAETPSAPRQPARSSFLDLG
ncbi:MAG: hypothetical protein M3487_10225, partial [Actinomycetota bacterium]|nr:hypothetical protein [Actinomycetota bacterium]